MSDARTEILARIRDALRYQRLQRDNRGRLDHRMGQPPRYERPPVPANLLQAFQSKLTGVHGGLRITGEEGVMAAIGACLEERDLECRLVAAPALEGLHWPADWAVRFGPSSGGDRVSVTPCFAAVAETGSVVLVSGPNSPTSLNFLPEFHIVLVHADQLVRNVEDVWAKLRGAGISPRTVNFITGPSKTGDIEQTMQYGAHGPRSLDAIVITPVPGDPRSILQGHPYKTA